MKKGLDVIIEKTEHVDKYDEAAMQIADIIKDNFSFSDNNIKFYDETQKKIIGILKNNFDKRYEDIGRSLMQEVRAFDHKNGHEFMTHLFAVPLLTPLGVMTIGPETFPNYNIENKYIGYTEKERFYRINDFTLFMRHARKQPLIVIMTFLAIYMIIGILFFTVK